MTGMLIRFEKTEGIFFEKLINIPAIMKRTQQYLITKKWSTYFSTRHRFHFAFHLRIAKVVEPSL
jgi:hypothetical protein